MRTSLLALLTVLAIAVPAVAATRNGLTPQSPKKGATVQEGSRPTFKGKAVGKGVIYVHVSTSRQTDTDGVIDDDAMIQKAKRSGSKFSLKARFFDFPEFWLNTPGTYYWQAHRIQCGEDGDDCLQESPIVKFKVG